MNPPTFLNGERTRLACCGGRPRRPLLAQTTPSSVTEVTFPRLTRFAFLLFLSLLFATPLQAHKPSDSYLRLTLTNNAIEGEWQIAFRDLDHVLPLDQNNDRILTWGEVKAQEPNIIDLAFRHLKLQTANGPLPLTATDFLANTLSDGGYAVLRFRAPAAPSLQIHYDLFFDVDAQHHGILIIGGAASPAHIFKLDDRDYALAAGAEPRAASFGAFVVEGIWHIWIGFDHILFLLALLLPTVVWRQNGGWQIAEKFAPVLLRVAKIITAFTLAHSITLALATLEIVKLPSALIESVIAISVLAAALNNLFPVVREGTWKVALLFGLIHGFGFANVFADLGVTGAHIILPLLAFNLGVETGQLAIVAAFLPIAYACRHARPYRAFVQFASAAVALIALIWTCERLFNFKALPF